MYLSFISTLGWSCTELTETTGRVTEDLLFRPSDDLCNYDVKQFGETHNKMVSEILEKTDYDNPNSTSLEGFYQTAVQLYPNQLNQTSFQDFNKVAETYIIPANEQNSPIKLLVDKEELNPLVEKELLEINDFLYIACENDQCGDLIWEEVEIREKNIQSSTDLNCNDKFILLGFYSVLKHSAIYWQNSLPKIGGFTEDDGDRGKDCAKCMKPKWKKVLVITADAITLLVGLVGGIACMASTTFLNPACWELIGAGGTFAPIMSVGVLSILCPSCPKETFCNLFPKGC